MPRHPQNIDRCQLLPLAVRPPQQALPRRPIPLAMSTCKVANLLVAE